MAILKRESFLVCPECLSFSDDFPPGLKEGDPCPYCLDVQFKLVMMNRRQFYQAIAKKIIGELL
jgi:hypothetical protein